MTPEHMKAAVEECEAYARICGLDDQMIRDIAHDNGVSFAALKEAMDI